MEEKVLWEGKPFYFGFPSFTRYKLTNQRLIIEEGFLTIRTNEIELFRVRDISVKKNIIERMFQMGDVALASTDVSNPLTILKNIKECEHVKDLIREAVRQQRNAEKFEIPDL